LTSAFREIAVRRNPNCPICSDHPTITTLTLAEQQVCELPTASLLSNGGPA